MEFTCKRYEFLKFKNRPYVHLWATWLSFWNLNATGYEWHDTMKGRHVSALRLFTCNLYDVLSKAPINSKIRHIISHTLKNYHSISRFSCRYHPSDPWVPHFRLYPTSMVHATRVSSRPFTVGGYMLYHNYFHNF